MVRRVVLGLALICGCGSQNSPSADSASSGSGGTTQPNDPGTGGTSGSSGTSGTSGVGTGASSGSSGPASTGRDWKTYPAIVDVPAPAALYALSDVHGGFARVTALLFANGILSSAPSSSTDAHWGAGAATLVVAGDMIDKGPSSVEVLDFFMALQVDAKKAGGLVIVTLGNHEAEFLVDPNNSKATNTDGIDPELTTKGLAPASLASGADPRGAWLRLLPFGARVGGWFFSHAGDTGGRTVPALETALETAVTMHADYNDPEIVGTTSILESRDWYTGKTTASTNATALGVKHIVFGHDPNALGTQGKIAVDPTNVLLRIDCGMSPDVDYSTGMILRVTQQGANDVVEELDATAKVKSLFTAPR